MTAAEYIRRELAAGRLTMQHLVVAICHFQAHRGLAVDGKPGPKTRDALGVGDGTEPVLIVEDGWLHGKGVERVPAHSSWSWGRMTPSAIVAHYTATDPGTAHAMAKRRTRPRLPWHRAASWHFTVSQDGKIWQQLPCHAIGAHAKDQRGTGARMALLDHRGRASAPNLCSIGIELEGHGDHFTAPQVDAARRLWAALVAAYDIPREQAMVAHADLDPRRRADPGPVWLGQHAPRILAHAYR